MPENHQWVLTGIAWCSMFEAGMPSSAPQMVLLTFAETKVRPAAGNTHNSYPNKYPPSTFKHTPVV